MLLPACSPTYCHGLQYLKESKWVGNEIKNRVCSLVDEGRRAHDTLEKLIRCWAKSGHWEAMIGENRRLCIISRWIFPHGRSKFPSIGWQSDHNFNPPAISRCTRKCTGNLADSSCELPDISRKKSSSIGRYPGSGNQYPPSHEQGIMHLWRS